MNNPMTRRRFFQVLACAAVAIGVPLPVGFPTERIRLFGMTPGGTVRVRWMKLPHPSVYEMLYSIENAALKSFDPAILSRFDHLPPPGWTKLEPGRALALYKPEPPPSASAVPPRDRWFIT